ncbi:PAS domain-containing protein [Sphingomonas yantingensis]|uniref:PAS domain-containing protein n=1 Tax=Sphingomonas yantingensis TaxID=1241761 RepID=A0A7W9AQF2_9SPHN|nr:PAS domain-containing protein [Sphingomonas yantingensis]MBB5698650.1 PAS domain-containing protein [Sphingomonas yantingensis]
MSDPAEFTPGTEACVTASELVRQFGLWQERALQQPVFVLRRGRPSLVLTSLDLMRRLCAPHSAAPDTALSTLLMDAMRESVLVVDGAGRLGEINRAARVAFGGGGAAAGLPLSRLFGESVAGFLQDLADRSRRVGAPELAEIALRDRRYSIVIVPFGDGALIVADDVSVDDEGEEAALRLSAMGAAFDALPGIGWARINLRGYIGAVGASLAALTGIERTTLLAVRFVTLIDAGDRAAVAQTIDEVIGDGAARQLPARLQRRDGGSIAVDLSLAAVRGRSGVEQVTIALATVHAPHKS